MSAARHVVLAIALACAVPAHSQNNAIKLLSLDEPIRPLPEKIYVDPNKAALGRRLFFDTRFSRDNKISCASCHDFSKGGADGRPRSIGVDGRIGPINTPTVFNATFNFRQLWNGSAGTLDEQVHVAVTSPNIFDTSWTTIIDKLSKDEALVRDFKSAYPDGLNRRNIAGALAIYEGSLITPSRFDAYLRGKANAITAQEKLGYAKFKSYGCVACHQGINVGGNMFQVFGVVRPYLRKVDARSEACNEADLGRYVVTKRDTDKHVFKVPGLRNVARTAPYFHDASAQTLEEAVDVMFKHQLGRTASREDKTLIVKFLNTLTGELPPAALPGPTR